MKPPSVRVEEKWTVGERTEEPVAAPPAPVGAGDSWLPPAAGGSAAAGPNPIAGGSTGGGASPAAWLANRKSRGRAPVEASVRQRRAVEAYCEELCAADATPAAISEALTAFGVSAARLGQRASADDQQRMLHRATRLAAASHALVATTGSGWRWRVVDALTAERDVGCRSVPTLLAHRGNGEISDDEDAALRDHLRECLRCQAMQVRMARAERAFVAVSQLGVTLPSVIGSADAVDEVAPAETPPAETPAPAETNPAEVAPATGASDARTPPPVPAGQPPATPPSDAPARRRRRHLGPIPVAPAVALLAVFGVGAAAVVSSGSSGHAGAGTASTPSTPSVAAAPAVVAHHRHVVHHRVHKAKAKHRPKPKPVPAAVTTTPTATTPTTSTGNTGSVGSSGNSGAPTPAPVAATPTPAPAPSSGGSGGGGGSSGGGSASSATIQQPSLGATSAPTQGIGNKP